MAIWQTKMWLLFLVLSTAGALRVDEDPAEDGTTAGPPMNVETTTGAPLPDMDALAAKSAKAKDCTVKAVKEAKTKQEAAQKKMKHLVAAQMVERKKAHESKVAAEKAVADEKFKGEAKKASISADAVAMQAYQAEADARTKAEETNMLSRVVDTSSSKQVDEVGDAEAQKNAAAENEKAAAFHAVEASKKKEEEDQEAAMTGETAQYYKEKEAVEVGDVAQTKAALKEATAAATRSAAAKANQDGLLEDAKKVAEAKGAAKIAAEKAFQEAADADQVSSDKAVATYMAKMHADMEAKEATKNAQEKAAAEKAAAATVVATRAATAAAAARGSVEAAQAKLLKATSGLEK